MYIIFQQAIATQSNAKTAANLAHVICTDSGNPPSRKFGAVATNSKQATVAKGRTVKY